MTCGGLISRLSVCLLPIGLASPVAAQELRPAPDYFVGALIATEFAQALAINCPTLSVNPVVAKAMSENVLNWLEEDGFDRANPAAGMIDATPRLQELQAKLIERHGLAGAKSDKVCAAGRAEMADKTDIGNLLVEVPAQ